ncbi:MAG: hypothetical protein E7615_01845 [Ruminococcaceae bacterium]|nr:hypothetical protein [Oscillospiraceae bacterium]
MVVCFAAIFISIKIRYAANDKKIENTPPEYLEDYYYYNQLTYKEQLLFKSIKSAAENFESESEIVPYKYTEKEFQRVAKAVTFDCPMLFYLNQNSFQLFCDGYKTSVTMNYNDTASNFTEMRMEIEAVSAAAMAYVKNAETDFEKAVILHDFLTSYCTYAGKKDTENNPNKTSHTAYGALVEKYAFCDGYAAAYKILLNRCGIECIIAEGATDVQPHLWNVVKQGDKYFHIDCTWNDSDVDFLSDLNFHGFFNLSDKEISKTHRFYTDFSLPVCDSDNNYYFQINANVSSTDLLEDTAYLQIKNAVSEKKTYFELYLSYTDNNKIPEGVILKAIDRVNGEHESSVLSRSYRIFSATQSGRAVTVQIYYIND